MKYKLIFLLLFNINLQSASVCSWMGSYGCVVLDTTANFFQASVMLAFQKYDKTLLIVWAEDWFWAARKKELTSEMKKEAKAIMDIQRDISHTISQIVIYAK